MKIENSRIYWPRMNADERGKSKKKSVQICENQRLKINIKQELTSSLRQRKIKKISVAFVAQAKPRRNGGTGWVLRKK